MTELTVLGMQERNERKEVTTECKRREKRKIRREKCCVAEQPWARLAERHTSGSVNFDWHIVKQ